MKDNFIYGGKGSSLIKLKNLGYNVPDFFVLTIDFFREFVDFNNLNNIYNLDNLTNNEEYKKKILNGNFSEEMLRRLYNEFDQLGSNKVSVRSSAIQEDGKNKSFAGQFYTGLNVSKDNLVVEIKKCYASLFEDNIINYINNKTNQLEMAVVVQKMINSNYSGVAFSTDFNVNNSNFIFIEACKGIGEKLVSGKVTPTKYYIRKKMNYIDQIIGDKLPIESEIISISKLAQKIESDYNMQMDIEWAINNHKIYILQARPIVGISKMKKLFKMVLSRPKILVYMQIEEETERLGISKVLNSLYYLKPIFYFCNNIFEEYYNYTSIEENVNLMVNYILKYYKKRFIEYVNEALLACKNIENDLDKLSIDEIKYLCNKIFPINNIVNFLEARLYNENVEKTKEDIDFIKYVIKDREYYDEIEYRIDDELEKRIKEKLTKEYLGFYRVMTIDEIFKDKKVSVDELKARNNGFAFYDGKIILKKDLNNFFKENAFNIVLKEEEKIIKEDCIKGSVAYPGKVKGIAKIVYSIEDTKKINEGDIIISPMTVPNFIDAVKRAIAIVTDEGGTVCHAALIARELKKTCIVGTKNATKILKDGMIIEVDGDMGIVKIINKESINE